MPLLVLQESTLCTPYRLNSPTPLLVLQGLPMPTPRLALHVVARPAHAERGDGETCARRKRAGTQSQARQRKGGSRAFRLAWLRIRLAGTGKNALANCTTLQQGVILLVPEPKNLPNGVTRIEHPKPKKTKAAGTPRGPPGTALRPAPGLF